MVHTSGEVATDGHRIGATKVGDRKRRLLIVPHNRASPMVVFVRRGCRGNRNHPYRQGFRFSRRQEAGVIRRRVVLGGLALALALVFGARPACAQEAEELLPTITGAAPGHEPGFTSLGRSPGAGGLPFENVPGAGEALLGGQPGPAFPRVPTATTMPGGGFQVPTPRGIRTPAAQPISSFPLYGPLAIPTGPAEEGPPGGLTLDQALDRLVSENLDLRAKYHEIPKAQADVLTAGLRANPLLFFDVQRIPYGGSGGASRGRASEPISTEYDLNVNHPLDLSGKRRARVDVASRARRVLDAQYQDAVRVEIDNLGTAFVNVLGERETARYAQASVAGLRGILATTRTQLENKVITESDFLQIKGQLDAAELGLADAEELLHDARRSLAVLLNIPPPGNETFEVRGTLHDRLGPTPPVDDLIRMALALRPDLAAFRLGIARAQADVRLAERNRFQDVYLLYQPYTLEGGVTSWAIGATVPLPVYNRNQGNIQRAQINVSQVRTELCAHEKRVVAEVQKADREYALTRTAVARIERELLPDAQRVRNTVYHQFTLGEVDAIAYLNAQRNYNDVVRQYRDTLVRHRRSMLRLNTVVGQRLLP
jgi:cobalt-zinc-cadmium efflux system outer membrane protein